MLKPIAALAAMAISAAGMAQTVSPAAQQVQQLAPQLVVFSGSAGNFESLVSGLTTGVPVTLTTAAADGTIQIVTFVPGGAALSPADIARNLETARQNLIARGVATPTAQQLAVALMGGALTTATGTVPLAGVLTGSTLPGAVQVRNELASAPTLVNGTTLPTSANLEALRTALGQGALTPARGPMSAFEVNQALQLAVNVLAQQGIVNPTPEQLRTALLGGTLLTPTGANVAVQGVLAGSVRNTSDSPSFNTSRSPLTSTSNSTTTAPVITPPRGSTAATGGTTPAPTGGRFR
jgi:hypothetical protein